MTTKKGRLCNDHPGSHLKRVQINKKTPSLWSTIQPMIKVRQALSSSLLSFQLYQLKCRPPLEHIWHTQESECCCCSCFDWKIRPHKRDAQSCVQRRRQQCSKSKSTSHCTLQWELSLLWQKLFSSSLLVKHTAQTVQLLLLLFLLFSLACMQTLTVVHWSDSNIDRLSNYRWKEWRERERAANMPSNS